MENGTEIAQICKTYNLQQTELAERFGIPLRTVQDWHAGRRTPPDYVTRMVIKLLEREQQDKENTVTQYAALTRRPGEPWRKMHPLFYAKSAYEAEMAIQKDKAHNPLAHKMEYKVVRREVTRSATEWTDV